ncbi:hypothetical protein A5715_00630 [Mycolicibacter heraklionensis]|nr:hypothetical protein A5715_00630 [Mycolicibacter heraklionensis]
MLAFVERCGINPAAVLAAGTPAWCALDDQHPDKLAAVLAAGVHHALRMDLSQEAAADASKAIAAADDWPAVARAIHHGRGAAYIPRQKEIA